jgi:Arc/MetJ family transcription regulator
MRTTIDINAELLEEAKKMAKARSKKETIELALEEFILRRKAGELINLEGRIALSYTLPELLERRKIDVPR